MDLYAVTFIDYGNADTVTVSKMRPLDPALAATPPLARECTLAFVRVQPPSEEFGREAALALSDAAFGRPMALRILGKDLAGRAQVEVTDPEAGAGASNSVNEELVKAGIARLSKNDARRVKRVAKGPADEAAALVARLEAAQAHARSRRLAMWRYGDVADSDDERR
jgi:staphylococcal nuclease domain-containing protein 1